MAMRSEAKSTTRSKINATAELKGGIKLSTTVAFIRNTVITGATTQTANNYKFEVLESAR